MFRKLTKFMALVVCLFFVASAFVGCSQKTELKREAKNLSTYEIVASLDDSTKTISATQKVEYKNRTGQTLESVCFHMYPTAFSEDAKIKPYTLASEVKCFPSGVNYGDMIIERVLVDGTEVEQEICGEDNNILKVNLVSPLENKKSVCIEIVFKTVLAQCTHRLGFGEDYINLGNWYPVACAYRDGEFCMTPYYSTGDPFFSDCANYKVTISYPEGFVLSSTGEMEGEETQDGVVTRVYSAKVVRDFAMHFAKNVTMLTGEVDDVLVNVVCNSEDASAQTYLETALKSVQLFNEKFGRYPYKTLSVCFTEFLHGGMEYPNIVFISDTVEQLVDIKKVIIHEIAHQWWYGVVGNDEVNEAWIDEALAEYSTLLYFENFAEDGLTREKMVEDAVNNYLLYADVIDSLELKLNESMQLALNEYSGEYEYVYMVYVKGLVFVDTLQQKIGDDAFFDGLKNLYKQNKFKIAGKEEFIKAFEKASGLELDSFVEEWLGGRVSVAEI